MEAKGQVRRLHIIYFLSRMGRIEQPHLIRVHHLTRNGVYLRDVKRWLADLRGKDMPEAFSWSYKRRYKTGYVWQDLLDDDLITPISDNEYVLKGSEVIPTALDHRHSFSLGEKKSISASAERHVERPIEAKTPDSKEDTLPKLPSDIIEQSPPFGSERSTLADDHDLQNLEQEKLLRTIKEATHERGQRDEIETHSSFYDKLLNKKRKKKIVESKEKQGTPTSTSLSSPNPSSTSSKKSSGGASNILRHLIRCGAVDTNDTTLVRTNPTGKFSSNLITYGPDCNPEIRKGDKLGGSARVFRTCLDQQSEYQQHQPQSSHRKSYDGGKSSQKTMHDEFTNRASAVYKPVGGPKCSQCGKYFKPEKMHAHMKSCRGIKVLAKIQATQEKQTCEISATPPKKASAFNYALAN